MSRFTGPRIRDSAFTLVELLVVISILGLLAGLSIPAISAGRASAQTAASTTNLKQIHTMVTTFLGGEQQHLSAGPVRGRSGSEWFQ